MNTPARVLCIFLVLCLALFALPPQMARAIPPSLTVTTLNDVAASDGYCSLREAIQAAVNNTASYECPAGTTADDTINFSVSGTINLTSTLPWITIPVNGKVIIDGGNTITLNGAAVDGELLKVDSANLLLSNITLTGPEGSGLPGNTNGIFSIYGNIELSNVTVTNFNRANSYAIYSRSSTYNIHHSTISNNQTGFNGSSYLSGEHTTLTVENVTLSGNTLYGLWLTTATATITSSTFTNNSGNGISFSNVTNLPGLALSVSSSTFSNNSGSTGPAINAANGSQASIDRCTFTNNQATSGVAPEGGAVNAYGSNTVLTITNSTFTGNHAAGNGGAISSGDGTLNVSNSTFTSNIADTYVVAKGGAIYAEGSASTQTNLSNLTIAGNTAVFGSAIEIYTGPAVLKNNTLSGNINSVGGYLPSSVHIAYPGTLTVISNNIFANPVGGSNCSDAVNTAGTNNLSTDNSCPGRITIDSSILLLGPLGSYGGLVQTLPLLPGSAALNAGDNAACTSSDARGIARPQMGTCDIGAFESRGFNLTLNTGNNQTALIGQAFTIPLRVTVSGVSNEPVSGGQIIFSAPDSGASATFAPQARATISVKGEPGAKIPAYAAALSATANSIQGNYHVYATSGADTNPLVVDFSLYNNAPPQVTSITLLDPNPSSAGTVHFWVTFTEDVNGVDVSDFNATGQGVSGASVSNVSGSASHYTVTVNTGSGTGTLRLDMLDNDSVKDLLNAPLNGSGTGSNFTTGEFYIIRPLVFYLPMIGR